MWSFEGFDTIGNLEIWLQVFNIPTTIYIDQDSLVLTIKTCLAVSGHCVKAYFDVSARLHTVLIKLLAFVINFKLW